MHRKRLLHSVAAASVAALGLVGTSTAAAEPSELGQHIASCARESLGQRADAPAVTCVHDGMVMSFATFGAMVEHMREMHGG